MAKKFAPGHVVDVRSGRHKGRQGVVTKVTTGWLFDRYLVKLEGVDRPASLSGKLLSLCPPPAPGWADAWIPGQR